uniref:TTF-type domain-containing protein n=1 Tax=Kalanchoe fedtschenkoi TaxID=63787 RepID=A0A7N0U754_KALFE
MTSSCYEKLQKKKKIENFIKSQRGALDKFVVKESQVSSENENIDVKFDENYGNESLSIDVDIFDPRYWDALDSKMIDILPVKGHKRDISFRKGPKNKLGRRFSSDLYIRILDNGEKQDRDWLVYSKELDRVFCFCCKIFKQGYKNVLLRIISIVNFLAKHSIAFRGTKERLYENNNGNFLGLIEMLAEFDPVIREHVRRITSDDIHFHYLGHIIQNELISLIASSIKAVKSSKSHQEQMSIILRYVDISSSSIIIEESFLGFMNVNDTTGQGLFDVLLQELKFVGLDVDNIKTIRFQISEVREALLQVSENDNDSKIKSETKSLAENELGDFEFVVAIIIWYDVLSSVNVVSKSLQSVDMLIDVTIEKIEGLIAFFTKFREVGFSNAIEEAKKIAIELDIDPVCPHRRQIRRKKILDENFHDESSVVSQSPEDAFRVNYFLYIVDQAISSLHKRFEQYKAYENVFGFLFSSTKLNTLNDASLKSSCDSLAIALRNGDCNDIDANELYVELKLLIQLLPGKDMRAVNILQYLLKLLKSYLRSSMSQERLNGLTLIAIENDQLEKVEYEDLIEDFVSENTRRL